MEIELNYEQWKQLQALIKVANSLEQETTRGDVRLEDSDTAIVIGEKYRIFLTD